MCTVTAKICVHTDRNKRIMKEITRCVRVMDYFYLTVIKNMGAIWQHSIGMEGER